MHTSDQPIVTPLIPIPDWWTSSLEQVEQIVSKQTRAGAARTLAHSPGGRPVYCYRYGCPEQDRKGTANFNSAVASGNVRAYFDRDGRKSPVLMIVAGIHGHEVEGMIGTLSLIRIIETGKDLAGHDQQELAAKLRQLRIVAVPLANPDGRARVPYGGWVGIPQDEMTRWGQGTRANGELYRWRPCKEVHPMQGDVGLLGAYFDDRGVNMMHDDWASPMSETTTSLLRLAAEEGPDCLINLHSYSSAPGILPVAFIPDAEQRRINSFSAKLYARLAAKGHQHGRLPDDLNGPGAFNLQSMFYHVGAALPILFESPHGVISPTAAATGYDAILDIHHQLFAQAADELLGR